MSVNGTLLLPGNPRASIAAGVAFAPEDRKEQGVILEMAISENIALPGLNRVARAGFINDREVNAQGESMAFSLIGVCAAALIGMMLVDYHANLKVHAQKN